MQTSRTPLPTTANLFAIVVAACLFGLTVLYHREASLCENNLDLASCTNLSAIPGVVGQSFVLARADGLFSRGEYQRAIRDYSRLVDTGWRLPATLGLTLAYLHLKEDRKAMALSETLARLAPHNAAVHCIRANLFARNGDTEKAREALYSAVHLIGGGAQCLRLVAGACVDDPAEGPSS